MTETKRNYPNSGALNPTREKRSERSPDWWGRLEISGDVLEALNQGKPIRVNGWEREGKYGQFISLSATIEKPREEQPSDAGAGEQRSWPSTGPQSTPPSRARFKPGTIEGNLARASTAEIPFDDDIPFIWALAFPATCLIASMVHGAVNVIA